MGSPLGVLFAQAFMAAVEEEVLADPTVRPALYCRYVDDILVEIRDTSSLQRLKQRLEEVSGLNFTTENNVDHKISFLDVNIDSSDGDYTTSVYRKPTDEGRCLNGRSQCPERYKSSVIRAYVHRALKHCSSWQLVHQELQRVKQILVDNDYDLHCIDNHIQEAIQQHQQPTDTQEHGDTISLFYRNQMTPGYKAEEQALQNIIKRNCKPAQTNDRIRLNIFYNSPTTTSLVMRNNMSFDPSPLKQTNVIYHYKCTIGNCAFLPNSGYVGYTTTTLSRRLTMHLQSGGPQQHTQQQHDSRLTRQQIVANTTIVAKASDWRHLVALEAITIRKRDPAINRQINARGTLHLYEGPRLC